MTAFMTITWLMPLVGFVEILGGILVMIPKTRALGAIVLFPVVIGILLTNTITEPSGLAMGLVVLVIDLWLIIENREKYLPMVR
jgi:putative oxidoreductase